MASKKPIAKIIPKMDYYDLLQEKDNKSVLTEQNTYLETHRIQQTSTKISKNSKLKVR